MNGPYAECNVFMCSGYIYIHSLNEGFRLQSDRSPSHTTGRPKLSAKLNCTIHCHVNLCYYELNLDSSNIYLCGLFKSSRLISMIYKSGFIVN